MSRHRHLLTEDAIPDRWYNIAADLPSMPPPPLNPGTGEPVGPEALAPIFPESLILQEVSAERWIPIPDPVREVYATWRPTPLHRARGLQPTSIARHLAAIRVFFRFLLASARIDEDPTRILETPHLVAFLERFKTA